MSECDLSYLISSMYYGREIMKVIVAMSMVIMMLIIIIMMMHMYDLYYYYIGVLYAKDSSGGELLSYQVYAILFCIGKQVMIVE